MRNVVLTCSLILLFVFALAFADWDPGDGYKMHYPQLPDETGWNVKACEGKFLADDWLCTESGEVSDIHFWGSWKNGYEGVIHTFTIQIYSDIPADPQDPVSYSRPGDLLWSKTIPIEQVAIRHITPDPQKLEGWFDPPDNILPYDHDNYFQYNIVGITEPFVQEQGHIYWLSITADVAFDPTGIQPEWGWKSTLDHWNDDAVYGDGLCIVPDNGTGTADLPADCPFTNPNGSGMMLIDGLPPGTTIDIDPIIDNFNCQMKTDCEAPGGTLGGSVLNFEAVITLDMTGTGELTGYSRKIDLPVVVEIHLAPRNPGDPVQVMAADLFYMNGMIMSDPDFNLLEVIAGSTTGLPSPGEMRLTDKEDGTFQVDSFFDITYRIDFEGAPGSPLEGLAGSTTGNVRMEQGADSWTELYEPIVTLPAKTNDFWVVLDPGGNFIDGGGSGFYGSGWYFYPEIAPWWNVWFYDHPFDYDRYKVVMVEFDVIQLDQAIPANVTVAVNWSTDIWSLEGNPPGERRPPLPEDGNEQLYIGRGVVYDNPQLTEIQHVIQEFVIPDYNPEWISIDVMGANFEIQNGFVTHECLPNSTDPVSLDLAFVINNSIDTCTNQDPGDANSNGIIDINDVIYLTDFIYTHGPAPSPIANGDPNGDCMINIGDLIYLVAYLDTGGPAPVDCTCQNPDQTKCCFDYTGNIDYDSEDIVDIADLVYFVDYQFRNGDAPPCLDEADIDGVAGIDVGDLVFMVDYQFRNGDAPPICPY